MKHPAEAVNSKFINKIRFETACKVLWDIFKKAGLYETLSIEKIEGLIFF